MTTYIALHLGRLSTSDHSHLLYGTYDHTYVALYLGCLSTWDHLTSHIEKHIRYLRHTPSQLSIPQSKHHGHLGKPTRRSCIPLVPHHVSKNSTSINMNMLGLIFLRPLTNLNCTNSHQWTTTNIVILYHPWPPIIFTKLYQTSYKQVSWLHPPALLHLEY